MNNNSGDILIIRNPKDAAEGAGGSDFDGPADSLPTEPLSEDEWPEPELPRNPLLPVPPLTRDMLPPVLAERVFDVASNMQCPPDFVAVPLVIDLGLVVGRKVRVRPNRGSWFVVPNLWGYVVSRPGTKKSPAILAAHDAIDRLQEAADRAYEAPRAAYDQLRIQRRLSLQALLRQTRQLELGSEAQQNIQRQIAELSAEIAPPVRRQYVTNDSTIEAFGELLSVNQNGMGMYNDEASLPSSLCSTTRPGAGTVASTSRRGRATSARSSTGSRLAARSSFLRFALASLVGFNLIGCADTWSRPRI